MSAHGREHRTRQTPNQPHGGRLEPPEHNTEPHMTFLPKTAEARQELLALLIALPLTLAGTGFLFYLIDAGVRVSI